MSNTGVRIFGCPTCGFRVDTNEQACPRCGNEFRKETLFECPFCGDLVRSGLDKCPSCHVSYSEFKARSAPKATDDSIDSLLMEIIKLESSSVREEEKRFSCPQCDLLLGGDETECPRCGKKLDVEIALQCPVCGSLVGANDIKCGECGTVFDEEAETASRAQEAESRLEEIMTIAGPGQNSEPARVSSERIEQPPKAEKIEFASSILETAPPEKKPEPQTVSAPPPESPGPEPEPEPIKAPPAPPAPKAASPAAPKKTRKLKAKPKQ